VREPHAFCVNFTLAQALPAWIYRKKRVGMVHDKDCGLIMKPRGMMGKFPLNPQWLNRFYLFLPRISFFAFYLTGVGVFCNHHRPPVG